MTGMPSLVQALADRYRIERELGAGGMATVYLAHDLKHDRKVAIKVLRPELAAVIGAERFLREIKTIATLQHPHILGLIDSGEVSGTAFYVMPFVEGESLRDRLNREKQLPIADAVRLGAQVAAALDYAHRHAVIHRDIKPENIMLHDGSALVADFGIALAVSSAGGGSRMTETGMSLGTPHYMSPEQAMGERTITARSDVYALGAMMYEMLVGDPPFTGSTAQAIIAKVMTEKPVSLQRQRDRVSDALEDAVLTALEKLPADRFATAAEFAAALEGEGRESRIASAVTRSGRRVHRKGGWRDQLRNPIVLALGAITAASAAVAAWSWRNGSGDAGDDVVRFAIPVPPSGQTNSLGYSNLSISRDGRVLVYVGQAQGRRLQLMVRRLDEVTARPLPGTEDASNPVFSPDGRWVAFNRSNQLFKVSLDGGAPQLLGTPPGTFNGMSWSATGGLVVSGNTALYVIPESGGQPTRFGTNAIAGELYRDAPLVLDEHGIVLYSSWPSVSVAGASIAIASLETGEAQVLDVRGAQPLGIVDGVLVYVTGTGVIMGAPIDVSGRRVTGPAVQLQSDVSVNNSTGLASAALSSGGTLFFQSGTQLSRVVIAGAGGNRTVLLDEPREYGFPRLSPDGRQLALTVGTADHRDIWLRDLEAGTLTRLTTEGTTNERPEWSPDGTRVLYRTDRGVRTSIWWSPADRSGEAAPLLSGPRLDVFEAVISPDGRHIVYQLDTLGADLYYRAMSGDTTPRPVAAAASSIETMPRLSPDGRWLAFTTNESGRDEIVVQPFPGPGARVQVSSGGGSEPIWARDGRRLFYRGEGQVMAATVRADQSFRVVARDTLFADRFAFATNPHANFDVMPDGMRFIFLEPASEGSMIVAANWRAVLRERMAQAAGR
jgi:serine/threonine-protein kinase